MFFRMSIGTGMSMAAQHAINPYPMYMNIPGLKIILPSTPYDLKGLLKAAVRDNNPVVCFEHSGLMDMTGDVPEEDYTVPFGCSIVRKPGSDVTIVALAKMVHLSLDVAEQMEEKGVSVEVIDPRTLMPLEPGRHQTVCIKNRKTGRRG